MALVRRAPKRKFLEQWEVESVGTSSEDESENESDRELQEAFAKGLIKPGLNIIEDPSKPWKKGPPKNDIPALEEKLEQMSTPSEWLDRLDLVSDLAPLGAEMALQIEREEQKRANLFKGNAKIPKVQPDLDPVLNDFKREIHFQRQAQTAVIEGIRRLHELGEKTKRPDDYFAQMMKDDEHMQKVRKMLMAKEEGQKKSEKARQQREHKKMNKVLQREALARKAAEKKKVLSDVKAFRKGKLKNLDFLEDKKKQPAKKGKGKKPLKNSKREFKDSKFGFGGRKRNSKRNNAESFLGVKKAKNPVGKGGKGGGGKPHRPGKTKRAQQKNRKTNSRR